MYSGSDHGPLDQWLLMGHLIRGSLKKSVVYQDRVEFAIGFGPWEGWRGNGSFSWCPFTLASFTKGTSELETVASDRRAYGLVGGVEQSISDKCALTP